MFINTCVNNVFLLVLELCSVQQQLIERFNFNKTSKEVCVVWCIQLGHKTSFVCGMLDSLSLLINYVYTCTIVCWKHEYSISNIFCFITKLPLPKKYRFKKIITYLSSSLLSEYRLFREYADDLEKAEVLECTDSVVECFLYLCGSPSVCLSLSEKNKCFGSKNTVQWHTSPSLGLLQNFLGPECIEYHLTKLVLDGNK